MLILTEDVKENREYYLPIIYMVKRHGSILSVAKALKVSHQLIGYWNRTRTIPDYWKVYLHKRYGIPYKAFFAQLDDGYPNKARGLRKAKSTSE